MRKVMEVRAMMSNLFNEVMSMDGSLFELDERGNVIPSEDDSQGEVYEDEELSMADKVLVNDVVMEIVKMSKNESYNGTM